MGDEELSEGTRYGRDVSPRWRTAFHGGYSRTFPFHLIEVETTLIDSWMQHSVGLFWNAFLATLMSSEETVETNFALQSVVAWVVRVPTLYTARRSDKGRLALCLIDIALRVIGQRLVRLPSIDSLELPFSTSSISLSRLASC